MEALQILKFNHQNGIIDFCSAIADNPKDLEAVTLDEVTDSDLLEQLHIIQGTV
jgi:hypothetical protein